MEETKDEVITTPYENFSSALDDDEYDNHA